VSVPDFSDYRDARDYLNGNYNAATPGGVARPNAAVPYPFLAPINSSYAFAVAPWVQYFDGYVNQDVWEGPEGDVLGLVATVDRQEFPWIAIAGTNRGYLDVSNIRFAMTSVEQAETYDFVGATQQILNPIRSFRSTGIALYGQVTALRASTALNRLNIRWGLNWISKRLRSIGLSFPFEQIDNTLFRNISTRVSNVLRFVQSNRGINAYRVLCDESTTPPEVAAQNRVVAKIFIQFTPTAEFVEFDIYITPQGFDFSTLAAS
jgi:phage tail sheath protein FI